MTYTETPSTPALTRENPLRKLRPDGVTRASFAVQLRCSVPTVQFSELGCYLSIPTVYRPHIEPDDYSTYQHFRQDKRRRNFPVGLPRARNFTQLLAKLGLKPFQFADRFCIQPAEVWKMLNHPDDDYLPQNLLQGFIQVGYDGFSEK